MYNRSWYIRLPKDKKFKYKYEMQNLQEILNLDRKNQEQKIQKANQDELQIIWQYLEELRFYLNVKIYFQKHEYLDKKFDTNKKAPKARFLDKIIKTNHLEQIQKMSESEAKQLKYIAENLLRTAVNTNNTKNLKAHFFQII